MRRSRRLAIAAGALCLIAIGGVGLSSATFSARSANPNSTFTAAADFCTNPGLQTVNSDRDTWVDENAPTVTNGSGTTMNVRSQNNGRNRRSLVGFTLPSTPSGCSVTAATLKLVATSVTSGRTIQALQISPSATWTEAGANWTNQPATTGTAATTASGSATGTRTWTITTQVQAMYGSTNANNGFLIRDATEGTSSGPAQAYATRDNGTAANRPVLEITFG
jgi:hypothetical protein